MGSRAVNLETLRKRIDEIDADVVRILNERARTAVEIGREKKRRGMPVVDAAREDEVLDRVRKLNGGPLGDADIQAIYRSVLEASARIQKDE